MFSDKRSGAAFTSTKFVLWKDLRVKTAWSAEAGWEDTVLVLMEVTNAVPVEPRLWSAALVGTLRGGNEASPK